MSDDIMSKDRVEVKKLLNTTLKYIISSVRRFIQLTDYLANESFLAKITISENCFYSSMYLLERTTQLKVILLDYLSYLG